MSHASTVSAWVINYIDLTNTYIILLCHNLTKPLQLSEKAHRKFVWCKHILEIGIMTLPLSAVDFRSWFQPSGVSCVSPFEVRPLRIFSNKLYQIVDARLTIEFCHRVSQRHAFIERNLITVIGVIIVVVIVMVVSVLFRFSALLLWWLWCAF